MPTGDMRKGNRQNPIPLPDLGRDLRATVTTHQHVRITINMGDLMRMADVTTIREAMDLLSARKQIAIISDMVVGEKIMMNITVVLVVCHLVQVIPLALRLPPHVSRFRLLLL